MFGSKILDSNCDGTYDIEIVSSGGSHSCGINMSGSIQCWGHNALGETSAPSGRFIQVSAVDSHSCGIDSTDSVQCWGTEGSNAIPPGNFQDWNGVQ